MKLLVSKIERKKLYNQEFNEKVLLEKNDDITNVDNKCNNIDSLVNVVLLMAKERQLLN